MTTDFIDLHCSHCDYCIFECGKPTYCGEINDEGCICEPLESITHCRLNYPPIKHVPKFKVNSRFDSRIGIYKILAIENDKYVIQREGSCEFSINGKYPIEKRDTDEIDIMYDIEDII